MTDILLIATAKYKQFIPQMLHSIRKHWKINHRTVLFTDEPQGLADVEFKIEHEKFPYCSMFRYHYFLDVEEKLKGNHVYYVDIDAYFNEDIGIDILSSLVAVRHCGYWFNSTLPQETNRDSVFIKYHFKNYYGGGFQGGERKSYLEACRWCKEKINEDLDKGIVPRNHDETAWNAYLTTKPRFLELSPDYHFPQECLFENEDRQEWRHAREHFINHCWKGNQPFTPRLVLIKKEHEKVR